MIGFVGCDPASGKSTALAPFISVFKKYMEAEVKALEEQENAIAVKNAILKKFVNRVIKNASKNLTLDNLIAFADIGFTEGNDYLRVMGETLRKKQDKILPPILLVNDLSSAALSVLMDQQGYVIQLEPDGGRFDFKVLRQLTKYWSDEGHSQVRRLAQVVYCARSLCDKSDVYSKEVFRRVYCRQRRAEHGTFRQSPHVYSCPVSCLGYTFSYTC
jgi:hypothetical protein